MKMARHPYTARTRQAHELNPELYEATLTDAGLHKVAAAWGRKPKLLAGTDYQIREEGGQGWIPLGTGNSVQTHRHDWIIVLRKRPHVPVIYGAQGSKLDQEQAMRLLVLFFPWVNNEEEATPEAPFIGNIWKEGMRDWRQALRAQLRQHGFPTEN